MGRLSDKYPQCKAAYQYDEEEEQFQWELKHEQELLDREERFQRELLTEKLKCLNALTESIMALAQSTKVSTVTNNVHLHIDNETTVEKIKEVISAFNNQA